MVIDSNFYMIFFALGITLMILGLKWKMGLLNILSAVVWLFLLIQFVDFPLLIGVMLGLIFLQIYLVVRGGNE